MQPQSERLRRIVLKAGKFEAASQAARWAISTAFLTLMLYSSLPGADFLDIEAFLDSEVERSEANRLHARILRLHTGTWI